MARAPIRTPGKAATAEETTTTTETEATSSPSEPVTTPIEPVQEATAEEMQARIKQLEAELAAKSKPTTTAVVSAPTTAKQYRSVLGPNGWTRKEI